ncbi:MAG: hypothetical protein HQK83_13290 [Fibrobacteria bacterium]|nr:hypothetical protein [Fibrobacteria bacterium]
MNKIYCDRGYKSKMGFSPGIFLFFLLFFISVPFLEAQDQKSSTLAFGGKIQLQREGEKRWRKITRKVGINNGDIIKTSYKSFLILQTVGKCRIVIGSSSKILFELTPGTENGEENSTIKLTLFEGAIFLITAKSQVTVFTSDGKASIAKGKFTVHYSRKKSLTTIASFKGPIVAQNIIKKENTNIPLGTFSTIKPDMNPISPTPLTNDVGDLLRRYFGDKFINNELKKANIRISENRPRKAVAEQVKTKKKDAAYEESTTIEPLFNVLEIRETIREIEGYSEKIYMSPYSLKTAPTGKFFVEMKGGIINTDPEKITISNGSRFSYGERESVSYMDFRIRSGMRLNDFSFAVNVPFATDNSQSYNLALSGIPGILDKIYFIDYQYKKYDIDIHCGEIRDATFNKGLLVNNFSNELKSQLSQPLGVTAEWNVNTFINTRAMLADLARPAIFGGNLFFDNGWIATGFSVMTDLSQGGGITYGNGFNSDSLTASSRFRASDPPDTFKKSKTDRVWGWDGYLESTMYNENQFSFYIYAGVAMVYENMFDRLGVSMQLPGINVIYKRFSFFLEGNGSNNRSHIGYFDDAYQENRSSIFVEENRAYSMNERHSPMGVSKGMRTGLNWQIMDQLWVGSSFGQVLGGNDAKERVRIDTVIEGTQKTITTTKNTHDSYLTELLLNRTFEVYFLGGKNLLPGLSRIEAHYRLNHGQMNEKLAPQYQRLSIDEINQYRHLNGAVSYSSFLSLYMSVNFLVEYNILKNFAVIAQVRGYGYDFNGNNIYDPGDLVTEYSGSVKMWF